MLIVASLQLPTKQKLEDISAAIYETDAYSKEKFNALGIASVNVRKVIRNILQDDPIIGIPINSIPNDLKDWAWQQRHKVKLWIVSKFVLDTKQEAEMPITNLEVNRYDSEISDLIGAGLLNIGDKLVMIYKPNNWEQNRYEYTVTNDRSIEILGQVFSSLSYAALAGIQDAGSDRKTVNA